MGSRLHDDAIVIDGILTLHQPDVRNLLNVSIFVDTPDDLEKVRKILIR